MCLLTLNEIRKKKKFLSKSPLQEEIAEIVKEFKIHTVLYTDRPVFVLDYINDKDAIINRYPKIKKQKPVFYDKKGFMNAVGKEKSLISNRVILYSFEKYFEMLRQVIDLVRNSPFFPRRQK